VQRITEVGLLKKKTTSGCKWTKAALFLSMVHGYYVTVTVIGMLDWLYCIPCHSGKKICGQQSAKVRFCYGELPDISL